MDFIGIIISISILISGLVSLFTGSVILWKNDQPVKDIVVARIIGGFYTLSGLLFLANDFEWEFGFPLRKMLRHSTLPGFLQDGLTDISYWFTDVLEPDYWVYAIFAAIIAFLITLIAPKVKQGAENASSLPDSSESSTSEN